MCDHAPNREAAMVVTHRKPDGTPSVWCDPCIAPLVKALNDGGLPTVASCCGHGGPFPPRVTLTDGRTIVVLPDDDAHDDYCAWVNPQTDAAAMNWTPTVVALPPEGVVVETVDSGGHVQPLVYERNLWFFPDRSMYVYYVPQAWRGGQS